MTNPIPKGAVVEIIDTCSTETTNKMLVPKRVRVNGADVGLIAAGGISLSELSDEAVLTVTLTLIPSRVEIKHERELR